jgi:hypothetical protein
MITKGGAKIKGLAEKTTNKEIKHIRSINYLLVFMVFQMSIYLSREILGSEILKRVLFSNKYIGSCRSFYR